MSFFLFNDLHTKLIRNMKSSATTAVILEKRKPLNNGLFPVKLRITYQREQHYYTLRDENGKSFSFTEQEFKKIKCERPREPYKEITLYLNGLEKHARDLIETLPVFSFELFEKKYFSNTSDNEDVFSALKNTASELKNEGRINTSVNFQSTLKSLQKFTGKKYLQYERITPAFLNQYEKWMLEQDKSPTTIGIYLRNLRIVINKAIRDGITKVEYPFGKGKYQIPVSRNIKKALSLHEVGLIMNYLVNDGTNEHKYRDYWIFSYLCNGINVKDIAKLKYKNIDEDVITFIREKTKRASKRNLRPITVVITQTIGRIIDRWGNKPVYSEQYIFPILEHNLTPEQESERIHQAIKMINKYIGQIAEKIGITHKVTSYTARHSFATVLKRSGASIEFISESLGHSNLQTTENYLADFEIDEKRKWAKELTKFN